MFMVVTVLLLPEGIKAPAVVLSPRVQRDGSKFQSDGATRTLDG
jgi:hypothetical protein